jgi:DNA-binding transcriptional MerR regulator
MSLLFYLPLYMSFSEAEIKLGKLYYTIGEVSRMFDVNTSLIRFWEKEFAIIKPKKNKKGNRLFTQKDIENFQKIYQLVKIEGYTLEGAKQKLRKGKVDSNETGNDQILSTLEKIKKELLQLKASL